jgi:hypothetical protein
LVWSEAAVFGVEMKTAMVAPVLAWGRQGWGTPLKFRHNLEDVASPQHHEFRHVEAMIQAPCEGGVYKIVQHIMAKLSIGHCDGGAPHTRSACSL